MRTVFIFGLLFTILLSACNKDENEFKKVLTSTDWGKPEIVRIPGYIGMITLNSCGESHQFSDNGIYYFKYKNCSLHLEWDCDWEWVEENKKLKLLSDGVIPYDIIIEIVELNEALLHTKEWKGKSDTTEAYWEYKYRPN